MLQKLFDHLLNMVENTMKGVSIASGCEISLEKKSQYPMTFIRLRATREKKSKINRGKICMLSFRVLSLRSFGEMRAADECAFYLHSVTMEA